MEPYYLAFVPDHFKTEKMCLGKKSIDTMICTRRYKGARVCENTVEREPGALMYVPDRLKTVKMCERAVEADPWQLYYVPHRF